MKEDDSCLHPTAVVYHGDCSLMRLTDRFYFDQNEEYYQFVKMSRYDEFKDDPNIKPLFDRKELSREKLLELSGPSGVGKSFYLQYILRHIRREGHLRAFYLGNPEIFLKSRVPYLVLLFELVYSLAEDLAADLYLKQLFYEKASLMYKTSNCRFQVFASALSEAVAHLKKSNIDLVVVNDQENVYDRIKETSNSDGMNEISSFLQEKTHGAYVLSSFSYTSESRKTSDKPSQLIRLLSDEELLAVLKSRCSPLDRHLLCHEGPAKEKYIRSTLELVICTLGRCPVDIHEMMNINITDRDQDIGTPIRERCYMYVPNVSEIRRRHQEFYDSLKDAEKESFLLLLSIAGRCPSIGSEGFYCYYSAPPSVTNSVSSGVSFGGYSEEQYKVVDLFFLNFNAFHEQEALQKRSADSMVDNAIAMCPADDSFLPDDNASIALFSGVNADPVSHKVEPEEEERHLTVMDFAKVASCSNLASVKVARKFLDGRYFFIDDHGFVRAYSEPAFKAIKSYHQEKEESINASKRLLEQLCWAAPGMVYEESFFLKFKGDEKGLLDKISILALYNAENTCKPSIHASIPIERKMNQALRLETVFETGKSTIFQCPPGFPIADFFIICPENDEANLNHFEFNILPDIKWIDEGLKKQDPRRSGATFIIGQLTINGEKHGKGDKELVEEFEESQSNSLSKYRKLYLRRMISDFVILCQKKNRNPCVLFLWMSKKIGNPSLYLDKSILCPSYEVIPAPADYIPKIDYNSSAFATRQSTSAHLQSQDSNASPPKNASRGKPSRIRPRAGTSHKNPKNPKIPYNPSSLATRQSTSAPSQLQDSKASPAKNASRGIPKRGRPSSDASQKNAKKPKNIKK